MSAVFNLFGNEINRIIEDVFNGNEESAMQEIKDMCEYTSDDVLNDLRDQPNEK